MEQKSEATLELLQQAIAAGHLYFVNEDAQPISMQDCFDSRCWAHLRSANDGEFYVQEMPGSRELLKPRYLALLGLDV
ncbi:hypothetical protein Q5H93_04485 [Hymenobacter sp. ASUV-10]|uniref:Uncharacterized protein n=1 Tax=Hymenobacter aranciens TaxID=3063996 RepID=A0ABT9B6S7_9BACT|nr:hypothetical protein [Hymenobacter sp. ASUV-10]MDO7873981.1 hypothetical protein [Hymenobacter sp. ASUV-10]